MSVVVTGATGQLGRLVVEHLLDRGVAPGEITATGRRVAALEDLAARGVRTAVADFDDPSTLGPAFAGADALLLVSASEPGRRVAALEDLAARGVRTAVADFDDPSTLAPAFAGADALLLVSASEPGGRVAQHRAAVDAAKAAGVGRIVYTSAPRATDTTLVLAPEHAATEELIAASGLPATILRNGWYHENYAPTLQTAAATGVVLTSTGSGRVASAARSDFAEAAAVVLTTDGHVGKVYELSGDTAWDFDEFTRTVASVLGKDVVRQEVTPDEHRAALVAAGLDEGTAGFLVALDGNIAEGTLDATSGELAALIGHPTLPLADGLRALASA